MKLTREKLLNALFQWEAESRQDGAISREEMLKKPVSEVAEMNTEHLWGILEQSEPAGAD